MEGASDETFWTSLKYDPNCEHQPLLWCPANVTMLAANNEQSKLWLPGEPNFKKGNCAVVRINNVKNAFGLAMASCRSKFRVICEVYCTKVKCACRANVSAKKCTV